MDANIAHEMSEAAIAEGRNEIIGPILLQIENAAAIGQLAITIFTKGDENENYIHEELRRRGFILEYYRGFLNISWKI